MKTNTETYPSINKKEKTHNKMERIIPKFSALKYDLST